MANRVVGVYDSKKKLLENVEELKAKGIDASDISIVAKDDDTANFYGEQTGAQTMADTYDADKDEGFFEKVKAAFQTKGEVETSDARTLTDKFMTLGLPEEEARKYHDKVEDGGIVVLVDRPAYEENGSKSSQGNNQEGISSTSSDAGAEPLASSSDIGTETTRNESDHPIEGTQNPAPGRDNFSDNALNHQENNENK
ncbi:general stress protein [Bacillus sp. FJAT-44742]|uniref:general stress protein n=1 Tax=Bacillus sp. FJAT-44742 TaxID=2014005 RepID=UPI000C24C612|nr:general stress protein [Bacillus sp. FJAT-44742]